MPPAPPVASRAVLIAVAVTVLAWASAFLVIRGVGTQLSGGSLALGRILVATVALSPLLLRSRWVRPTGREWVQVAVFGVTWFGAYNVALNIAEHTLDAGTAAMIVNIGPLLIALGAGAFLGEGIPRWLAIGAAVAFVGVVLIGLSGAAGPTDPAGAAWALGAAVAYAVGVLFQKPTLRRIPPVQVTWLGSAIGTLACLPFLPALLREAGEASAGVLWGMVYLGVVPTALAFTTWAFALSRMPAGRLGITTYAVPPLVVVLGIAVFGEVPAPLAVLGGALCLLGVALSRRRAAASA